ncbi:hypothetical protein ABFX02_09G069200 [Erythranthe guttata]
MAAFSSSSSLFEQNQPFIIDSIFLPNSPSTINNININNNKMLCSSSPFEEPNSTYLSCFPQFFQPDDDANPQTLINNLHQNSNNITTINNNNNDANSSVMSVTNKNSMDSSSYSIVTHKCDLSIDQVLTTTTATTPVDEKTMKKRKSKEGSSPNSAQSKDKREVSKEKKQKKMKECKEKKILVEEAPTGYIHVRARRGQATDSHSLAERVRRERISERMKLLQALVPGCDKVTGKALMLDEIINYVQSLQNQVEFLSMKLASVNPMFYDFGVDLESFMVRPDQDLSNLPNMQECHPTVTANDHYHMLLENSANSFIFQASVDEHRQKNINQSGLISSSLFPFN